MATQTTNYSLVKPAYEDQADVQAINGNMDIIDETMHNNEVGLAQAEDNIAILIVRQTGTGTFNATADTYIMSENRMFYTWRRGLMLTAYIAFKIGTNERTTDFVDVGNFPSNHIPVSLFINHVPVQNDTNMISVRINNTGILSVYIPFTSGYGKWVRTVFTVPLANSVL